jgi:uncharacterized protein (DUF2147 family)
MKHIIMIFAGVLLWAASVFAASSDDILGLWLNQEKDAKIEIFKCNEKYYGKIVWLQEPDYPVASSEGVPGTPKLDHNNPDRTLRLKRVMGLQIVHNFSFAGNGLWNDGKVYDPNNGKTYSGKMTLVSPYQLHLRGFIGIALIGRTAVWTKPEAGTGKHGKKY